MHGVPYHESKYTTGVIPCQINTKRYLTSQIWTKLGSYIVPVEKFTHSQFQHYMLYGFRVRASQKVNFRQILAYPLALNQP